MRTKHLTRHLLWIIAFSLLSCERYLDEKRDDSLDIPSTLEDLQKLMNNSQVINTSFSGLSELGTDDFYFPPGNMGMLTSFFVETYRWSAELPYDLAMTSINWRAPYEAIMVANLILEKVAEVSGGSEQHRQELIGAAYFVRGYCALHLALTYSPVYSPDLAERIPGIPIPLSSDINEKIVRLSLARVYAQLTDDLEKAAEYLSLSSRDLTQPNKLAAWAALSRAHFMMQDYGKALEFCELIVPHLPDITDFNDINYGLAITYPVFNQETLYYASSGTAYVLGSFYARVSEELISMYHEDDLRLRAFYLRNQDGSFSFKAPLSGYDGSIFMGISYSEIYLNYAESLARLGREGESADVVNALIEKRFEPGKFIPYLQDGILDKIIAERRKELVFRGLRLPDLKRLNLEERYAKTLYRTVDGIQISLPPNDERYVYPIPESATSKWE